MEEMSYVQSNRDHTLFTKHNSSGCLTVLKVYIDDIVLIGHDTPEAKLLKKKLSREFSNKYLGKLKMLSQN